MPDLVLTNTTYASAKRFGALYYYGERTDEDFKFRKGEHLQTKVEQWYFGNINRLEAEKLLLLPINDNGSFLIRNSESEIHGYSLSGELFKHIFFHRMSINYLTKINLFTIKIVLIIRFTNWLFLIYLK